MFVELIDQLRCPAAHEETWLVLSADEVRERHVVRGTLGCPVCGERYPVEEGTAWFRQVDGAGGAGGRGADADPGWTVRLAAFLGLGDVRGVVALYGSWARYAEPLGDLVDGVEFVAVAPGEPTHAMLSTIEPQAGAAIPLATGTLQGAALAHTALPADAAEAARVLRPGGRLVAPAATPVPFGIVELARDAAWWVGERDAAPSGIVGITRKRPAG